MKLGRRFTHERSLGRGRKWRGFKEGLWPLQRCAETGLTCSCSFQELFRYTEENRTFLIALRRAFHEFQLVKGIRHSSWLHEEALGTLIDHRMGFVNIDQAPYTKGMPRPRPR